MDESLQIFILEKIALERDMNKTFIETIKEFRVPKLSYEDQKRIANYEGQIFKLNRWESEVKNLK